MSDKVIWILRAVILFVFIMIIWIVIRSCNQDSGEVPETIIIHDTAVVTRYQTELKRDTVVKWFEKIVYKNSEPKYIYHQKTDTVFRDKVKTLDVMLKVNKSKNKLNIYAYDNNNMLLKEYVYYDVAPEFTATSVTGDIKVKSKLFYFSPAVFTRFETDYILNDKQLSAGIKSRLSYKDIVQLELGTGYKHSFSNTANKFFIYSELSYIF